MITKPIVYAIITVLTVLAVITFFQGMKDPVVRTLLGLADESVLDRGIKERYEEWQQLDTEAVNSVHALTFGINALAFTNSHLKEDTDAREAFIKDNFRDNERVFGNQIVRPTYLDSETIYFKGRSEELIADQLAYLIVQCKKKYEDEGTFTRCFTGDFKDFKGELKKDDIREAFERMKQSADCDKTCQDDINGITDFTDLENLKWAIEGGAITSTNSYANDRQVKICAQRSKLFGIIPVPLAHDILVVDDTKDTRCPYPDNAFEFGVKVKNFNLPQEDIIDKNIAQKWLTGYGTPAYILVYEQLERDEATHWAPYMYSPDLKNIIVIQSLFLVFDVIPFGRAGKAFLEQSAKSSIRRAGQEVTEDLVEETTERIVKEGLVDPLEEIAKKSKNPIRFFEKIKAFIEEQRNLVSEGGEGAVKELVEETLEQTAKDASEEVLERAGIRQLHVQVMSSVKDNLDAVLDRTGIALSNEQKTAFVKRIQARIRALEPIIERADKLTVRIEPDDAEFKTLFSERLQEIPGIGPKYGEIIREQFDTVYREVQAKAPPGWSEEMIQQKAVREFKGSLEELFKEPGISRIHYKEYVMVEVGRVSESAFGLAEKEAFSDEGVNLVLKHIDAMFQSGERNTDVLVARYRKSLESAGLEESEIDILAQSFNDDIIPKEKKLLNELNLDHEQIAELREGIQEEMDRELRLAHLGLGSSKILREKLLEVSRQLKKLADIRDPRVLQQEWERIFQEIDTTLENLRPSDRSAVLRDAAESVPSADAFDPVVSPQDYARIGAALEKANNLHQFMRNAGIRETLGGAIIINKRLMYGRSFKTKAVVALYLLAYIKHNSVQQYASVGTNALGLIVPYYGISTYDDKWTYQWHYSEDYDLYVDFFRHFAQDDPDHPEYASERYTGLLPEVEGYYLSLIRDKLKYWFDQPDARFRLVSPCKADVMMRVTQCECIGEKLGPRELSLPVIGTIYAREAVYETGTYNKYLGRTVKHFDGENPMLYRIDENGNLVKDCPKPNLFKQGINLFRTTDKTFTPTCIEINPIMDAQASPNYCYHGKSRSMAIADILLNYGLPLAGSMLGAGISSPTGPGAVIGAAAGGWAGGVGGGIAYAKLSSDRQWPKHN